MIEVLHVKHSSISLFEYFVSAFRSFAVQTKSMLSNRAIVCFLGYVTISISIFLILWTFRQLFERNYCLAEIYTEIYISHIDNIKGLYVSFGLFYISRITGLLRFLFRGRCYISAHTYITTVLITFAILFFSEYERRI